MAIRKLPIPAEALRDHSALLGKPGAGKSVAAKVVFEHEMRQGHRTGCIDPKGDWWGVRLQPNGKVASAFKVLVFGGEHADVPISDTMGKALGTILAGSSENFIIDLSAFTVAGMRRFMIGFAEAFFDHNRAPITLFVDEADQLAPQRLSGDQTVLLHRMERLIRQGRQRGIIMWMLTQRPAVLNKNLLMMAETLIAMKITGTHDRKAIRDWMEVHDPETASMVEKGLSKLSVGQAFAYVPSAEFLEQVQFPLNSTYDSGRTPRHGEKVESVKLKPIDVGEIAKLLGGGEAPSDELAIAKAEARAAKDALTAERAGHRETRAELASTNQQYDKLLNIFVAIQMRMGAAIGSPAIEPLGLDKPFEQFVMVEESDGVVRAIPRAGDNPGLAKKARGRVRRANPAKES